MMKSKQPLLDHEKQTKPLEGEVTLENARTKAVKFAAQERSQLSKGKAKITK